MEPQYHHQVDLYEPQLDETLDRPVAVKVGTLQMKDGKVILSGVRPNDARFLQTLACYIPEERRTVTINDGEDWLKALPLNLRGTMIWAEASDQ